MDLTITVDGIDRTNYILWQSFRKEDKLNNRADSCSFQVRKYAGKDWKPSVGDEVIVEDGATRIFGGLVLRVDSYSEGAKLQKHRVTCKDWSHYLDKKLVIERYEDQTVNAIIDDLVSEYTSGFTTDNVSCSITIGSIAFNYITVSDAFQMLAEHVNYSWYIDYNKDIHFFSKNTEESPFDLSDTAGNHIFNSLTLREDLSQLRNVVIVRGGTKEGNSRTETFKGDGSKDSFALGYKFSSEPTVTLDGANQTVGIDYLDKDADYDVMWNFNEKYIRFTGSAPSDGSDVSVAGTPLIPIIVRAIDEDSIDEYGQYEFRKIDKSINTPEEARQFAVAQLDAYRQSIKEGSFETYESGLRAGQIINVQSDIRNIDEDFLIQGVTLTARSPDDAIYTVSLATLRTVGIIDFLQGLLLDETKTVEVGEDEVLEKYYTDHVTIEITEDIELHVSLSDEQTISVDEQIRQDPWTIEWVLAAYFPTDDADPKRPGRLDYSFHVS